MVGNGSLVIRKIPLVPEFLVDFLLMEEVAHGHALNVFDGGHGQLDGTLLLLAFP